MYPCNVSACIAGTMLKESIAAVRIIFDARAVKAALKPFAHPAEVPVGWKERAYRLVVLLEFRDHGGPVESAAAV